MCGGSGCDRCENGELWIKGCPNDECRDIVPVIKLVDLFYKGVPPVTGGALDQAAWFVHAARTLKHEEALAEAD